MTKDFVGDQLKTIAVKRGLASKYGDRLGQDFGQHESDGAVRMVADGLSALEIKDHSIPLALLVVYIRPHRGFCLMILENL